MTVATSHPPVASAPPTPSSHVNSNRSCKWERVGYAQPTSGSDSSISDDGGAKKKRRSHRPRGCRGGGSRRARKERRELQFLTQKREDCNSISLLTPMDNKAPQKFQETAPHHRKMELLSKMKPGSFLSTKDLIPALPGLQSSSSFSSTGSSEGSNHSYLHNSMTSKSSNFDILPSMSLVPTKQHSFNSRSSYRAMSALPPLPSAMDSIENVEPQKNHSKQVGFSSDTKPTSLLVGRNPVGEIFSCNLTAPPNNYPKSNGSSNYHTERIKMQQDMLAGGGSLFATSPRSFLFGTKKAPCFF